MFLVVVCLCPSTHLSPKNFLHEYCKQDLIKSVIRQETEQATTSQEVNIGRLRKNNREYRELRRMDRETHRK